MPLNPETLATFLRGYTRLAILAVGSRLRGDDAAGLLTAALLRRRLNRLKVENVLILFGDTAPENVTGQIKKYRPSHLIILDAADTGRQPGSLDQIDPAGLSSNLSASTHSLPIKMILEYVQHFAPCEATILGIQPQTVHFGHRPTTPIREASRTLARLLATAINY